MTHAMMITRWDRNETSKPQIKVQCVKTGTFIELSKEIETLGYEYSETVLDHETFIKEDNPENLIFLYPLEEEVKDVKK